MRRAWAAGDRGLAAAAITDEMLEQITVIGTPDECRRKMGRFRANGVDLPIVAFPHGASRDTMLGTLDALAPAGV